MALKIIPKSAPLDQAARPRAVPSKRPTPKSITPSQSDDNKFVHVENTKVIGEVE
jgi:hypothetical protein